MSRFARWFLIVLVVGSAAMAPVRAQEASAGCMPTNPATLVSSSFCFSCLFPMQIGGVAMGDLRSFPKDMAQGGCLCPGRFGITTPGLVNGAWIPTHLVESTRSAGCSSVLGGSSLLGAAFGRARAGTHLKRNDTAAISGYHVNIFTYPTSIITDSLPFAACSLPPMPEAFNLEYMSSLDPMFASDALSLVMTPDAVLFANPVAQTACAADAAASTLLGPINALYHCAGTWGSVFPLTGQAPQADAAIKEALLSQTRAVAVQHRRLSMWLRYTPLAVCTNVPMPVMPKAQYKFQSTSPIPNALFNLWIGSDVTLTKTESLTVPVVGEDFISTLWSFEQCCGNL